MGAPDGGSRPTKICFTDLDGTLAHSENTMHKLGTVSYTYPESDVRHLAREVEFIDNETKRKHRLIRLLPTPRGQVSYISVRTLERLQSLRQAGVLVVLVTAARMGTLVARSPGLPACDAYLIESGGRILRLDPKPLSMLPLVEDMAWRRRFDAHASLHFEEQTPPEARVGAVWDCYRDMAGREGLSIDSGYTTTFRAKGKAEALEATAREVAEDASKPYHGKVRCFYNLGQLDIMPAGSGKLNAAKYVMEMHGAKPEDCVMLCDDQNDIELAEAVGKAFVPTVTHPSIRNAAQARPDHYVLAENIDDAERNPSGRVDGTMATDLVLDKVLEHFGVAVV